MQGRVLLFFTATTKKSNTTINICHKYQVIILYRSCIVCIVESDMSEGTKFNVAVAFFILSMTWNRCLQRVVYTYVIAKSWLTQCSWSCCDEVWRVDTECSFLLSVRLWNRLSTHRCLPDCRKNVKGHLPANVQFINFRAKSPSVATITCTLATVTGFSAVDAHPCLRSSLRSSHYSSNLPKHSKPCAWESFISIKKVSKAVTYFCSCLVNLIWMDDWQELTTDFGK